jgi:RNA polymerase sigma factor (sigma-70 family)
MSTPHPIRTTCEALQLLAIRRDGNAWAFLIERHGPAILRVAARVSADAALCEDICQETLLQLREHAGRFVPQACSAPDEAEALARAWIMRIACCTALKLLRTRSRSTKHEVRAATAPQQAAPEAEAIAAETAARIRDELAALPEPQRDAVALRFFGGLPYEQLGAALRISQDAAKKRVQRGLDAMRARLAAGGALFSAALLVKSLEGTASASVVTAVATTATPLSAAADGTAAAAKFSLDASRQAAWQALIHSPQMPSLTLSGALLTGGSTMLGKIGLGAGIAALCALSVGGVLEVREARQTAAEAAAAVETNAAQMRALEIKLEGQREDVAAMRRLMEARNSELTSLRDKVADLDKKGAGGINDVVVANPQFRALRTQDGNVMHLDLQPLVAEANGNGANAQAMQEAMKQAQARMDEVRAKIEAAQKRAANDPTNALKVQPGAGNGVKFERSLQTIDLPNGGRMTIQMQGDAALGNPPNLPPPPPLPQTPVVPPAPPADKALDDGKGQNF